jgi:pimeloyl-ACP methyl ester carboxylesterase
MRCCPMLLVGQSLGALVARVYAGRYPDEVAGMVFVDRALALMLRPSLHGSQPTLL